MLREWRCRHQGGVYALGVAISPAGDMAVASLVRVRFVPARPGSYFGQPMAAGHIYTVAGNGWSGKTLAD